MRLLPALLTLAALNAQAYQVAQGSNTCLYGVRAATLAYGMAVDDPMTPSYSLLRAALQYQVKRQPFPVDPEHAVKSLKFMVDVIKARGRHEYLEFEPAEVGDYYVRKNCFTYIEVPE